MAMVALAALAGWWAADRSAGGPPDATGAARPQALGPVQIAVPADWRTLRVSATGIPRVAGAPALAFDPAPGLSARVLLTVAPLSSIGSASLVPSAVLGAAREPLRRPVASRLDGHPAWTYAGVPAGRRGETMDVTILPTTAGVVTIVCVAPRVASSVADDCRSALRLRLARERAFAPTRDLALRWQLPGVVRRLDRVRPPAREALRSARSPDSQSRQARRLAAAHGAAARELSSLARTAAAARAVQALSESAGAYRALARAAEARDGGTFSRATRQVRRADRRLVASLAAIERR